MLRSLGDRLVEIFDTLVSKINNRVNKYGDKKVRNSFMWTSAILFLLFIVLILVLAALSVFYEGWTFFEGIYFAFITLSTIGFGDFVPSEPHKSQNHAAHHVALFVIVTFIYMTVGLAVVSSVLVSVSRVF